MASFLLPALLALSSAQLAASQSDQTTWGAVIFTLYGDSTPQLTTPHPTLTPLGAQQAMLAGSAIRTRYISGPSDNITASHPVAGISTTYLDHSQLSILASSEQPIVASAQAFLQGLYPPVESPQPGALLADGSAVEMPILNGYQYPRIEAISASDFNYVWIAGDDQCALHSVSSANYSLSAEYNATSASTWSFYQSLIPTVFQGLIPSSMVSYYNAHTLWTYAHSASLHNTTVASSLPPPSLARLRALASQRAYHINGNLSVPYAAIAGQTLAGKVLALLSGIPSAPAAEKLTLLFGSYEPFLAFSSLSGLANSTQDFRALPLPGSVMAFEVFSPSANATRPEARDLWVRFLFRNGTAPEERLTAYPLFGRGKSAVDMRWTDFEEGMAAIAITGPGDWCRACASLAVFCAAFLQNSGAAGKAGNQSKAGAVMALENSGMTRASAGVLGAGVTVAVVMVVGAAMAMGGWRVYRREGGRGRSKGGFKGKEKLPSDVDLTHMVVKGGVGEGAVGRQERVGSWEMGMTGRGGEEGGKAQEGGEGEGERVRSAADYGRSQEEEDEVQVSPHADPVKIDDRV